VFTKASLLVGKTTITAADNTKRDVVKTIKFVRR
jgi:hypothetical protein